MDGGASALDGADEPEGQYADEQADQRQRESNPGDQLKLKHVLSQGQKMQNTDEELNHH